MRRNAFPRVSKTRIIQTYPGCGLHILQECSQPICALSISRHGVGAVCRNGIGGKRTDESHFVKAIHFKWWPLAFPFVMPFDMIRAEVRCAMDMLSPRKNITFLALARRAALYTSHLTVFCSFPADTFTSYVLEAESTAARKIRADPRFSLFLPFSEATNSAFLPKTVLYSLPLICSLTSPGL